ncbi:hypothetical protein [Actinomadura madurae]|uniref:hypothetical protein n=1 Tax=Actinomadura madurae TaxID=1993 RepID=UPI0020D22C75|nr:hypothetical protein [Actinomadura madurae]MCP9947272.1 hypothetical protein [Actinomadura madurae]MCP9964035.1 hypothetical protein [Actinomadura madurae]MCQ0011995.1 hypothetical protein [Actinomadura madurae]
MSPRSRRRTPPGETPTDEEYDALRADVAAIRTTVNALLASLRAAGLIAES